ncbi:MAG: hypothetical protein CL587_18710 [Alteromonadaceae bacterium]|nr:hypothetical protein [Alteromonadaceae bacterium]
MVIAPAQGHAQARRGPVTHTQSMWRRKGRRNSSGQKWDLSGLACEKNIVEVSGGQCAGTIPE